MSVLQKLRLSIAPPATAERNVEISPANHSPRGFSALGAGSSGSGDFALPHLASLLRELNSNPADAAKAADIMLGLLYPPGTPLPPSLTAPPDESALLPRDVELEKRLQAWCSRLGFTPDGIRVDHADGGATPVDKAVHTFQSLMQRAKAPPPLDMARALDTARAATAASVSAGGGGERSRREIEDLVRMSLQRPNQLYVDTLKQTLDLAPIARPRARVRPETSHLPGGATVRAANLPRLLDAAGRIKPGQLPPLGGAPAGAPVGQRVSEASEMLTPRPPNDAKHGRVFYRKGRKRHGTHHSSEGRMKSQVVKQEILQEVAQTARCGKARSFADAARIAAKTHRDLNAVGAGAAANGAAAAKPWNFLLAGLSSTQQAVQHDARSPGRVDPYRVGRGLVRERRLHDASRVYLEALEHAPADPRLQRNFEMTMNALRTTTPAPWARWPWEIHHFEVATEETEKAPPGPMDPPVQLKNGQLMVEVGWPQYSKMHQMDWITGYELEIAEISPLEGQLPFKSIYLGERRKVQLNDLTEPGDIIVRVRAFKRRVLAPKFVPGPWSDEVQMAASGAGTSTNVEIDDIPPLWRAIDIEDLLKYERHSADPQYNWETLLRTLYTHRLNLKIAFRYYALEGTATSTDTDPNTMDMRQFANFAKSTGLIDRQFGLSDCDRLYMRAVRKPAGLGTTVAPDNPMLMRVSNAVEKHEQTDGKELPNAKHWWERTSRAVHVAGAIASRKGGNVMHQDQFVAALVRLAVIKYPQHKLVAEKLQALCDDKLAPHVSDYLKLLQDDFSDQMRSKLMRHVLGKHREELHTIFKLYAQLDRSEEAGGKKQLQTMNIRELGELCADADLYDVGAGAHFGVRELITAFVKVNIDDEIYYQNDMNNSSAELVFDEFEEVVGRIFHGKEWSLVPEEEKLAMEKDREGALERTFHEWLEFTFVPTVMECARTKWPQHFKQSGEAVKEYRLGEKAELSVKSMVDPNDRPPTPAVVCR